MSALIEDLQYTLGEGPCVDAYRLDMAVLEPDLADPVVPRWDTITFSLEFPSAEHFWGFLMSSNPMGRALVAELADEQRTEVQEVLAGMLRERSNGTGAAVLSIDVNVAVATK